VIQTNTRECYRHDRNPTLKCRAIAITIEPKVSLAQENPTLNFLKFML
jgi:hypothetical protein